MADKRAQLDAQKLAAKNYHSRIQHATNKEDALTSALSAAESLLKALKLATDPQEKVAIKNQCSVYMDLATSIKSNQHWQPTIPTVTARDQDDLIGQRTTQATIAAAHAYSRVDLASDSSGSTTCPTPSTTTVGSSRALSDTHEDHSIQSRLSNNASGTTRNSPVSTRPKNKSFTQAAKPSTQIYRLTEPLSTRKRSKREEIILLKASIVNGFKCPPWEKPPPSSEFVLQKGANLFIDTHDLSLSAYQQQFFQDWLRPDQAIPPQFMVSKSADVKGPSMSTSRTMDLVQDAATDCSVVSSLCAAIARHERGHHQILANKLYPFDKTLGMPILSPNGKYIARLNFNGCWRKVVIDDRLPVSSTNRLLHVVDRQSPGLLWPILLEKAYLKVRGGYDFPGSNSCSDLWTLTGWIPEQVFLQESDTVPAQVWKRIFTAFQYGDVLVTVGTGRMSGRQEKELGIQGQHSYVVLDMKETERDRLLLVKNPWGEGKGWKGPRASAILAMDVSTPNSDESVHGVEAYHRASIPTKDQPHPTTFWIGLEQVLQHFESLYLNWNPGLFDYRQDIHFEWNVDAQQPTNGCIVEHPQFAFSNQASDEVWFLLSRHFRDAPSAVKDESDAFNDGSLRPTADVDPTGEQQKGYMSIYVCDGHGDRIYIKETYLESSDYVTTPQCLLRFQADAREQYTIVIDQDELPPSLYTFTLSAFSNSSLILEPATQKYPQQKVESGSWTRRSAGGKTDSTRYFENPQYSLEMKEQGSLVILLTSTHEHPMHVKLALGAGKRIYRLQSRDVLADSGDHRKGCVLAEIHNLQPGVYTIICSLFETGQTGDYTLRVDSTTVVSLMQIPRDGAGQLSKKLTPACFGPQVSKIAAPLLPRRLASYTIVARFLRATSPRSVTDFGKLARSPLRLSVELGRGPERRFLITSENGEYADYDFIRSEQVTIDPSIGVQGDAWLVLDRLSGPRGAVEEWYEVEIFTDMPDAYEVGVWRNWDD